VVAGIHHHKLSAEAVCGAEAVTRAGVIIDDGIMRPGGQDEDSGVREAFGNDAVAHEAVQDDDGRGSGEAEFQEAGEAARQEGGFPQGCRGDGFVGVEVHDPRDQGAAPGAHVEGGHCGDQGRAGECDHDVEVSQQGEAEGGGKGERREIQGPAPVGGLAESGRADAQDADAAPRFGASEELGRRIIGVAGGNDSDLMAGSGQGGCQIGRVLGGRGDVRVEGLVEEEDSHGGQASLSANTARFSLRCVFSAFNRK